MNKATNTEIAYLAGFIDGEGCFKINKTQGASLEITQCNLEILQKLKSTFKIGRVRKCIRQKPIHKQRWIWAISGKNDLEPLLTELLPYLIIKREQARLLLEYLRTFSRYKGYGHLPLYIKNKRIELYRKVRKLNKRGAGIDLLLEDIGEETENDQLIFKEVKSNV